MCYLVTFIIDYANVVFFQRVVCCSASARNFVPFADKNNFYSTVTFFGQLYKFDAQIAWSAISVNIYDL